MNCFDTSSIGPVLTDLARNVHLDVVAVTHQTPGQRERGCLAGVAGIVVSGDQYAVDALWRNPRFEQGRIGRGPHRNAKANRGRQSRFYALGYAKCAFDSGKPALHCATTNGVRNPA